MLKLLEAGRSVALLRFGCAAYAKAKSESAFRASACVFSYALTRLEAGADCAGG